MRCWPRSSRTREQERCSPVLEPIQNLLKLKRMSVENNVSSFYRWCRGRDSNPHGSLHTPLKRARLPITPPRQDLRKIAVYSGAEFPFAVPVFAGDAAFALASGVCSFAVAAGSAGAAAAGAVVLVAGAGDSAVVVSNTETFPLNAGIEISNADTMNTIAATIVALDRTEAVPRGANAALDTLLVKRAPASVLPGCRSTEITSTMQEIKNIAYKK